MKFVSEHGELIFKILRSLYVDDFTGGADTTNKANELYQLLVEILKEGGFPVHKFVTNDSELQNLVNKDLKSKEIVKVLGLPWDTILDEICVDFHDVIEKVENPTKRDIASALMKIFDPTGLVGPITLNAKLILQEAWQRKLNWDSPLPNDLQNLWEN